MDYRAVFALGIVLCLLLASFSDVSAGENRSNERRTTFRFFRLQRFCQHVDKYVHLVLNLVLMLNIIVVAANNKTNHKKIQVRPIASFLQQRTARPMLTRTLVWEAIRTSTAETTFNRENGSEEQNHFDLSMSRLK